MDDKKTNTDDILDAIRDMMGEKKGSEQNKLPPDVLELTKPVDNLSIDKDENILELNNPINVDNKTEAFDSGDIPEKKIFDDQIIRNIVKQQINTLPNDKIDQIIREELENFISEKVMSAEIIFKPKKESK